MQQHMAYATGLSMQCSAQCQLTITHCFGLGAMKHRIGYHIQTAMHLAPAGQDARHPAHAGAALGQGKPAGEGSGAVPNMPKLP